MNITTRPDFLKIANEIHLQNKSLAEWAAIESDDMFQTGAFVGGFDATEMEFCFSYLDPGKGEYWFQISLANVENIINGEAVSIDLRKAEN